MSNTRRSGSLHSAGSLQTLHRRLMTEGLPVTNANKEFVVDAVRTITENLLWGDQNDVDEIFMYFCEANMMAVFTSIIAQYGLPAYVKIQTLKALHILLQNLSNEKSLLYLCSRNHINGLISAVSLDTTDEDVTSWFVTLLKSLVLRVKPDTITLFFNSATSTPFPVFTGAVNLLSHGDSMVRTHSQAITLRIFELVKDNTELAVFLGKQSSYYNFVAESLRKCYKSVIRSANQFNQKETDRLLVELEDCLLYIHDVVSCGVVEVADALMDCILLRAIIPELIRPACGSTTAKVNLDLREFASVLMCIIMTMKVTNSESLLLVLSFFMFAENWPSSDAFSNALQDEVWSTPEEEEPTVSQRQESFQTIPSTSSDFDERGLDWPGVAEAPQVVRRCLYRLQALGGREDNPCMQKDNLFRKQLIGILSSRDVETAQWSSSYVAILGLTGFLFKLKPRSYLSEEVLKYLRVLPSEDDQGASIHQLVLTLILRSIGSLNARLVSATCRWIFAVADATSETTLAHLRTWEIKSLTEARKALFAKFLALTSNVMPVATLRSFEEEWMLLLNEPLVDPLTVASSGSLLNVGAIDSAQYMQDDRYSLRNTIRSGLILVKGLAALTMTTMEQLHTNEAIGNTADVTGTIRPEYKARIYDSQESIGVRLSRSRSSSLSSLSDESYSKKIFEVGCRVSLGLTSHKAAMDPSVKCNLGSLEFIRCWAKRRTDTATPDDNFCTGVRYFLAQEGYLMLLEPDYRKAGCGIIRFLELLHRINFAVDATQPLIIILQANPSNSECMTNNSVSARKDFGAALFGVNTTGSFGGHSTVILQFEDHARRMIAEAILLRELLSCARRLTSRIHSVLGG